MSWASSVSRAGRRLGLLARFSRSPFAGSELTVRRLPSSLEEGIDGVLEVQFDRWVVFEDTLFVAFQVRSRDGARPRRALVLFSSCAVEVPVPPAGDVRTAVPVPATHTGTRVGLAFELADGRTVVEWSPGGRALAGDPAAELHARFGAELAARPAGRILEIGSRARSGREYRSVVPEGWAYTGLDVVAGPNVDVVGDVHHLGDLFDDDERFDAVFAISVFEHVFVPWSAVLEMNRVLAPGGLVFVATHQTYPLHDEPWDFWRFSDRAWAALFNRATGYEILATALGEPASVVPHAATLATWNIHATPASLVSSVLARKTGDPSVSWPVDDSSGPPSPYPQ